MTTSTQGAVGPGKIHQIAMLAGMLESLEQGLQRTDADAYRKLVGALRAQLEGVSVDDALRQLFAASPATAEIYENLSYEHAGLCLRPIDVAMRAEQSAARVIARARTAQPRSGA